jgi:hypothetical protein
MKKLITTSIAFLALATSASASPPAPAHRADYVAQQHALSHVGYWQRLRVDHLRGRDSYVYYLLWREGDKLCKYAREPHVVVYTRSKVLREYDFGRWNVVCS